MTENIKAALDIANKCDGKKPIKDFNDIFQILHEYYLKLQGITPTIQAITKFIQEIQYLHHMTFNFKNEKFEEVVKRVNNMSIELKNLIRQIHECLVSTEKEKNLNFKAYYDSFKVLITEEFLKLKNEFEFLRIDTHFGHQQKLYEKINQLIAYLKTVPKDDNHFYFVIQLLEKLQTIPSFPQDVFSTSSSILQSQFYDFSDLEKTITSILHTLNPQFFQLGCIIDAHGTVPCTIFSPSKRIKLESELSTNIKQLEFIKLSISENIISDILKFQESIDIARIIYERIKSIQLHVNFFKDSLQDIDGIKHQPAVHDREIYMKLYNIMKKLHSACTTHRTQTEKYPNKTRNFLITSLTFFIAIIKKETHIRLKTYRNEEESQTSPKKSCFSMNSDNI